MGLWQGRGLHVKALELLLSLGQQEGQVSSALRGVRATVDYLRKLPASELEVVVRFSAWPLRCEPQEGLRIFCDPSDPPSSEPERASGIPLHTTAAAALRRGGPLPPDARRARLCPAARRASARLPGHDRTALRPGRGGIKM
ncbi:hypothetical protein T492DRAFT_525731 [Pavlovales sp. CCMP2436]|nr:hypothetical protein T492DRAFT_525731 [Pavlovales sp. CCMP2436]